MTPNLHLNESFHAYIFLLHVYYQRYTSRTSCLSLVLLAGHTSHCNMASALSQRPNEIVFPVRESTRERQPSVAHLPYDIWIDIIAVLADDKQTLSQLALLSRGLHGFVMPTLYQRIDLEATRRRNQSRELHKSQGRLQHWSRGRFDPAACVKAIPSRSPFFLFLRTVKNRPSLGELVQTVKLTRPDKDEFVDAAVNLLLEKLPRLRKLGLDAQWINIDYRATFLKHNPMNLLRHVELIRIGRESNLLRTLLQRCHIESITAQGSRLRLLMLDCTTHNMSSLLTLKILHEDQHNDVEESELERLLTWPRALERLHCSFPSGKDWKPWTLEVSNPTMLGQVLQPVAHSLKELKLDCNRSAGMASNGTRLDLSDGFPCLRVLQIPAFCLFAAETPGVTRNGTYELLPPTLQELQVLFTKGWGMFYVGGRAGMNYRKERRMAAEDPATYQWLTEIARYKTTRFSSLKRVAVVEEGGRGMWTASKTVKALFDTASIALDVRLRD